MQTSNCGSCYQRQWFRKGSGCAGVSVALALLALGPIAPSAAPSRPNLTILREMYSQYSEIGRNEYLYFTQRCSGLMFAANSISGDERGELFELTERAYLKFAQLSFSVYQNAFNLNEENAMKKSIQSIGEFSNIYIQYMNESYIASGNYLSGYLVDQDLAYCGRFLQENGD